MPDPIHVLVVDPRPVIHAGLVRFLSDGPGFRVVGEDERRTASVAVVGGPDASAELAQLRAEKPGRGVLVLSECEDPAVARQALTEGAAGYILLKTTGAGLVAAVRAVANGGTYLDPAVAEGVVTGKTEDGLSEREIQVLKMIAVGYSNKEIAGRLKMSVKTVETYKARALEKLRLHSRVDTVRYAVRHGWLHDGAFAELERLGRPRPEEQAD